MGKMRRHGGFSLVEVLMAVGTLAVGMIFIGGTFLVGIHFTTISSERTIATVVAQEAFSKVRIFGVDAYDPNWIPGVRFTPLELLKPWSDPDVVAPAEFAYPSTPTVADKQYFWSALCRRLPSDPNHSLQVVVFVSRKVGAASLYEGPDPLAPSDRPIPMLVGVAGTPGSNVLGIVDSGRRETRWVRPGQTIVENSTGRIYRVVDRDAAGQVILDKPWLGDDAVWVVPPPVAGGRGPCIDVYPGTVRFNPP